MTGPRIHQFDPLSEQVAAPVRSLPPSTRRYGPTPSPRPRTGSAWSRMPSPGTSCGSREPSGLRAPSAGGAPAWPCWRAASRAVRRGIRRGRSPCISPRIAKAGGDSGTRCSTAAFIRSAGTVQTPASRSISDQRAPNASPVRAAVSTVKAISFAATPGCSATACMNAGTSLKGSAAWCSTFGPWLASAADSQVALPTGRVLAAPVTPCRSPVQARTLSVRAPGRPSGLPGPDRLQCLQHQAGVDRRTGSSPNTG